MARFPLFWRLVFRIRSKDKGATLKFETRNRLAALVFRIYVLLGGR